MCFDTCVITFINCSISTLYQNIEKRSSLKIWNFQFKAIPLTVYIWWKCVHQLNNYQLFLNRYSQFYDQDTLRYILSTTNFLTFPLNFVAYQDSTVYFTHYIYIYVVYRMYQMCVSIYNRTLFVFINTKIFVLYYI